MNILFIAPMPPPITGHSLAAKVFLDDLNIDHNVKIVDLSKDSLRSGDVYIKRIIEVAVIIKNIWKKSKNKDIIYLTISESFFGNIKDLLIYLVCFSSLSKMYIHLHGGSIKKMLFDRHKLLYNINKFFINKLAGVIISGNSHKIIFDGLIHNNKIHIAPNFAQDYLFITEKEIENKFSNIKPLKVLFMSNLIPEKGYNELVDAYLSLDKNMKNIIRIELAGRFELESQKKVFLDKIVGVDQIRYHGIVDDAQKYILFSQSHVFCLPTSLFEGQPISILEAYASGCVVLTTGQSGIRDIFMDLVNGYEIEDRSAYSIKIVLEKIFNNPGNLLNIALSNRRLAGMKYRESTYKSLLRSIIESPIS